jgi:hypothetical protein
MQDTSGAVTLQEFGAMEELLVHATEAGETMTYHDIISPVPSTLFLCFWVLFILMPYLFT